MPSPRAEMVAQIDARFANRLRQVRRSRGLSARELGEMVGLSSASVLNSEVGEYAAHRGHEAVRRPPRVVSIGEAIALCQALGVGLDLMCRPGPVEIPLGPEDDQS
jgi:transcriptional regulator with XRE-family HTH domain